MLGYSWMLPPTPTSKLASGGVQVLYFTISAEGLVVDLLASSFFFFWLTEHFISSLTSHSAFILVK